MTKPKTIPKGYKQTKIGVLPVEWEVVKLKEAAGLQTGLAKGKKNQENTIMLPYLRVANVQDGYLDLSEIKEIEVEKHRVERYRLRDGDVLMNEGGDFDKLGRGAIWKDELPLCLHQNHVFAVRAKKDQILPYFLAAFAASEKGKLYFKRSSKQTTNLASINSSQLKAMPIPLPPLPEQKKIAKILSTWDDAIQTLTQLINAKKDQKRGLMQRLLTGEVRLPGFELSKEKVNTKFGQFPADWLVVKIKEIATEVSRKNKKGIEYPVMSCTKHSGLVDSLKYFGKRIFSKDTSTYKMVERNQFAYATNHIEEGSIGYQDIHDIGLISPMYTAFKTNNKVDDAFLYRVLKSPLFVHKYGANTSASVDRRGSLRWKQFSLLKLSLPSLKEQRAIANILTTADQELTLLETQLTQLKEQKRGLMQRLLTGQIRVSSLPALSPGEGAA